MAVSETLCAPYRWPPLPPTPTDPSTPSTLSTPSIPPPHPPLPTPMEGSQCALDGHLRAAGRLHSHRSHFGSRYTLGLLRLRKPFLARSSSPCLPLPLALLACVGRDTALAARCPLDRSSARAQPLSDSLAEWSKALASGASPQGRGFKPHSCHLRTPLVSEALNPTARQTLNFKTPTPRSPRNPKF